MKQRMVAREVEDLRVVCSSKLGGAGVFWEPFSYLPRALVSKKDASSSGFFCVSTPLSAGPTKIWVEEAGGWVGKLPNAPSVSCWGRRVLFLLLKRILCPV